MALKSSRNSSASAKAGGVAKMVVECAVGVDAVVRGLVCGWGGSLREVEGAERGVGAGVEGLLGGRWEE